MVGLKAGFGASVLFSGSAATSPFGFMVGLKAGFGASVLFSGSVATSPFGFMVGLKAGFRASVVFSVSAATSHFGFMVGLKAGFGVVGAPGGGVAAAGFIVGRNPAAEAAFIADCIGSVAPAGCFNVCCFP